MLDLISRRRWFFLVSGVVIALGLASLLIPPGLRLGLEFTSGASFTLQFEQKVEQQELRSALIDLGHREVIIQRVGDSFFVRLGEIAPEEKEGLETALKERFGPLTVLDFAKVSPLVAKEIVRDTGLALVLAAVGILLYIVWAFRKMPHPFRWGSAAIMALVHDVIIMLGVFSVLGRLFNLEVDALFITAVLAVVGYSVNNVVVVFDRLRENLSKGVSRSFAGTVNRSLVQALSRNLNTALTTLFALLAVLLFGGITTRNFALALVIGIVVGVYTAVFIAAQLLVAWQKEK